MRFAKLTASYSSQRPKTDSHKKAQKAQEFFVAFVPFRG
jgi:hypothetical protein